MVDLELDQGLAVITIDRPHARNAIAPQTMHELEKAIDAAEGALALVIRGAAIGPSYRVGISRNSAR